MSYGISAVRLDLGRETRIRTAEFFDLPGKRSQHEIVSGTWILVFFHNLTSLRLLWSIGSWRIVTTTMGKLIQLYDCLGTSSYLFPLSLLSSTKPQTSCHFKLLCWGSCCEVTWLKESLPKTSFLSWDCRKRNAFQSHLLSWWLSWCDICFYVLLSFGWSLQIGHALQEYSGGYKVENALSSSNLMPQWVIMDLFHNFSNNTSTVTTLWHQLLPSYRRGHQHMLSFCKEAFISRWCRFYSP